ncbi:polysaccharide biosynthesis tyrosine autokinase [uncultured Desulfuromonas sp.]|uniref:GumC family protein n=1 Tax=uncultured Desulfuromonas sp. TaxID=181013 RepID=UPI00261A7CBD|nr:polysaccharide biosynthesis tyrosine autokinase [uncultured Desulfuromonas sp.]
MNTKEEEIHLRDYLRIINKRRGTVVMVLIVVLALTLLRTFSATPLYSGTTKVMIEKVAPSELVDAYRYNSWDPEYYETQFQLIQSQGVGRRVVDKLKLEETWDSYMGGAEENSSLLQGVGNWFREVKTIVFKTLGLGRTASESAEEETEAGSGRSLADGLASMISGGISVSPVEESRIVDISYVSTNPQFAALIANSVAEAYIEETIEMKMESTRRSLDWMTKKADEERKKLEKTEIDLQDYMRANDLVTLEDRIAVLPQKLSQIGTELIRAEANRENLEASYYKARKVSNDPDAAETIPRIAEDKGLQTLREQIIKAEQHAMELSGKYGRKHPSMIKAANDLEVLKNKKRQIVTRLIAGMRNEYELALSFENNLLDQMKKTKAEALNLNEKFIQYGVLKREIDTNRQLFDALLVKMKEQSITGETQPVNLWIVEEASVPTYPISPRKTRNILLGILVGLFGGVGLAFFIDYLDNTVKYPEETESQLDTPVLGLIMFHKTENQNVEEVVLKEPLSPLAESYKALRTGVLLSAADAPPRKILVTSSEAGAGKTTTSCNLALSLAQSEKRVLLIDCDLRKPRMHKVFGLSNKSGLSTYLAGVSAGGFLQEGPIPNLTLMSSGPIPPNPSELLTSARMQKLLDTLQESFDIIICDTPPLLSVADARILSRVCDGVIVVTKARQTTYEMARKALKGLRDVNSTVLGVVINALNLEKSDYYYYNYYQYYYSAYKEEKPQEEAA